MSQLDYNMDDNHFDNFVFRRTRKRKPMQKIVEKSLGQGKESSSQGLSNLQSKMNAVRKSKKRGHKNILRKLRTQGFFANRNNHKVVYNQVRKMAKEIDGLSQKLIDAKMPCKCQDRKGSRMRYKNFGGETDVKTLWNKYKTPLLIGGAVYFFFFSPMGKKLIK